MSDDDGPISDGRATFLLEAEMRLHPFYDCVRQAQLYCYAKGAVAHQQFNCAGCGVKQTMGEPNVFYKTGKCEECGHTTNIERDGCNYMLYIGASL